MRKWFLCRLTDLPEVVYNKVKQWTLICWFQISCSALCYQDQSTLNRNSFPVQLLAWTSHFPLCKLRNIGSSVFICDRITFDQHDFQRLKIQFCMNKFSLYLHENNHFPNTHSCSPHHQLHSSPCQVYINMIWFNKPTSVS